LPIREVGVGLELDW